MSGRRAKARRRTSHAVAVASLVSGTIAALFPGIALALPEGGTVAAGSATVSAPTATSMRIDQGTDRLIMDWTRFNIAATESVRFQQPSAASIALNRVAGQEPTSIYGSLSANGQIFLINPSGILFGSSSRVDVAALTASTLAMTNPDFLNGKYRFTQDPSAANAAVINQGVITAGPGGYVALLGAAARNEGVIQAQLGSIALAAGKAATLDMRGDGLIQFVVTDAVAGSVSGPDGTTLAAYVSNTGTLQADGGMVTLQAKAATDVIRSVVNQEGVVRATSLVNRGGVITLVAEGDHATVSNTGTLDVSAGEAGAGPGAVTVAGEEVVHAGTILARGADQAGGSVRLTADVLINTGLTDAGGAAGGSVTIETTRYLGSGTVKVSGTAGDGGSVRILARDYLIQTSGESLSANGGVVGQGGHISVQAAQRVFSSASLSAHGTGDGQRGGAITLLADEVMLYGANINASGEGGGTVLIGGDYQGGNPAIPNASRTWINYSTTIRADATQRGDGGTVIIWSDYDTRYAGHVSARGGAQSGAGGLIEVSGKDTLVFGGTADAGAAHGVPGTLLLDPKNIIIDSAAGGLNSFQLVDPTPGAGNNFGASTSVTVLSNDNVVAANPLDDFAASNAGAVHLFNGTTGALVSTLTGSTVSDQIGTGVTALTNGNYVVRSTSWDNGAVVNAGAVTLGSGTTGVSGAVSAANSLVGTTASDTVGTVTALTNGNYVVISNNWNNGAVADAGAVTWGSGTTGVVGAISAANSLVGTTASDAIGNPGVTALSNGNYVVRSFVWDNGAAVDAGAVTWGSGTTGVVGAVSAANSLVGTTASDTVGSGITELSNGNYVAHSSFWDGAATNVGAVTFGSGTTGVVGAVSAANSLVGTKASDQVGNGGVTALTNGNYVVRSTVWDNGAVDSAGAATFGSGTTGIVGAVSAANSLVGTTASDQVGRASCRERVLRLV